MDTRQAAFGLLLLFPIHPNLKNLELCGAIVVSNDNFLVIPASSFSYVQFWFGFASNVPVWLLASDSWVVQVMNLMTFYQNRSVSGALPVCMGMFHNLLKVHCRFSNSLCLPLLLCLFTSSRSI